MVSLARSTGHTREVPLRGDGGFLPNDRTLRRAHYGVAGRFECALGAGTSYQDIPDSPVRTLQRARQLLCLGNAAYCALEQSCETIAFYCKTGQRYSGQIVKTANALAVVSTTSTLSAVLLVSAFGLDASAVSTFGGIAGSGAVLSWVAIGITSVLITTTAGWALYRRYRRHKLQRVQPLEVINTITKINARLRSHSETWTAEHYSAASTETAGRLDDYTKNLCSAPGFEVDVLDRMRTAAEIIKSGADREFDSGREEGEVEDAEDAQAQAAPRSYGMDELLPWITRVLEQCQHFNAILDLPDVTDGSGEEAFYCTLLKTSEKDLAKRALLPDDGSIASVEVRAELGEEDSATSFTNGAPPPRRPVVKLRRRPRLRPHGPPFTPVLTAHGEFDIYCDFDTFVGSNAMVVSTTDAVACMELCHKHNAGGFVQWKGITFFRTQSPKALRNELRPVPGAVAYIFRRDNQQCRELRVKVTLTNGRKVLCHKTIIDFHKLHQELSQLHTSVRDLAGTDWHSHHSKQSKYPPEFERYLKEVLALATSKEFDASVSAEDYLAALQGIQVEKAIRVFCNIETGGGGIVTSLRHPYDNPTISLRHPYGLTPYIRRTFS